MLILAKHPINIDNEVIPEGAEVEIKDLLAEKLIQVGLAEKVQKQDKKAAIKNAKSR